MMLMSLKSLHFEQYDGEVNSKSSFSGSKLKVRILEMHVLTIEWSIFRLYTKGTHRICVS